MSKSLNRIHFLDPMRSILMMLGIVIHASNVYTTNGNWLIYASESSVLADYLIAVIHSFRMPAFFIMSGYFCVLALRKYPVKNFLQIRIQRILIPLVAAAVILNSTQSLLLSSTGFGTMTVEHFIYSGGWVSHLWFLNNLVVYFLASALIYWSLKGRTGDWLQQLFARVDVVPVFVILLLLPLLSIGVLALNYVGFPLYSQLFGFLDLFILADYSPFYAFGVLLALNKRLWARFLSPNIVAILVLLVCGSLVKMAIDGYDEVWKYACYVYATKLVNWCAACLCFYLFYRYLNKPSLKWQFWSDASYTVYLFHHVLVISLGLLLIQSPLPLLFNLAVLIGITLCLTLLIHTHVVLRYRWARWLFNGKTQIRVNLANSPR